MSKVVLSVALLGQSETAVNRERLAELLDMQGEFPSRYRCLIWEFLLQLPRNSDAYQVCSTYYVRAASRPDCSA